MFYYYKKLGYNKSPSGLNLFVAPRQKNLGSSLAQQATHAPQTDTPQTAHDVTACQKQLKHKHLDKARTEVEQEACYIFKNLNFGFETNTFGEKKSP